MTTLEILWILGTIFCMWWSYKWIVEEMDILIIIPILLTLASLYHLAVYFKELITTPLW